MAISDKLNYLIETKSKFKDRLNSLGAEIVESTTFRNYLTWLDEFYGEASDKTDLAKNGVVGRTNQESTTGKNLLPTNASYWESGHYDVSGIKTNFRTRMRVKNLVSISPSTTYYVFNALNKQLIIREYNANKEFIYNTGPIDSGNTFTTESNTYYLGISIEITYSEYNETASQLFMCNNNVVDKTYEPYTGGEPSPSSDYPQEINNLSGDVEYKVRGKNLVDVSNLSNVLITPSTGVETENQSWRATDYNDSLKPNTTYCASWVSSNNYFQVGVIYYDENKNYLSGESLSTSGAYEKTFTTPSNFKYYRITYSVSVSGSSVTRNLIQIEQNTTRTSYEPYISESFPLSLKSRNLFDSNGKIIENFINNSGMTYTLDNGIYTLNGTNTQRYIYLRYNVELEPGSYIFTGCPKGGSFTGYSCIVRVGTEPLFDYGDGISFTLTEKETVMVYPVRVGADSITVNNLQFKPMLEKVDNLFVGYDNMQSGFLPQSGSYPTTNSGYANAKYQLIELKQGESVITSGSTISGRIRLIDKDTNKIIKSIDVEENDYLISTGSYSSGFGNGTIIAKKDIILGVMVLYSGFVDNFIISKISPYEPYYDINLCNISDYKDRIYSQNGKFYLEEKNGKAVLDGSEDWTNAEETKRFRLILRQFKANTSNNTLLGYFTNYYVEKTPTQTWQKQQGFCFDMRYALCVWDDYYATNADLAGFKTWLSTHNLIFYGVLATPTATGITQENYPTLYSQLLAIQEFLTKYKINKEFLLDYSSPEIEY